MKADVRGLEPLLLTHSVNGFLGAGIAAPCVSLLESIVLRV